MVILWGCVFLMSEVPLYRVLAVLMFLLALQPTQRATKGDRARLFFFFFITLKPRVE